jgi:hypothetical protein
VLKQPQVTCLALCTCKRAVPTRHTPNGRALCLRFQPSLSGKENWDYCVAQGSIGVGPPLHDPMANVYLLPASMSTSGSDLPCSFSFDTAATPTLTAASATTLAKNATLTLTGTGFARGGGSPTVEVCGGRSCAVASYDATTITCTMPDCPSLSTLPVVVGVPTMGYAALDGSIVAVTWNRQRPRGSPQ